MLACIKHSSLLFQRLNCGPRRFAVFVPEQHPCFLCNKPNNLEPVSLKYFFFTIVSVRRWGWWSLISRLRCFWGCNVKKFFGRYWNDWVSLNYFSFMIIPVCGWGWRSLTLRLCCFWECNIKTFFGRYWNGWDYLKYFFFVIISVRGWGWRRLISRLAGFENAM